MKNVQRFALLFFFSILFGNVEKNIDREKFTSRMKELMRRFYCIREIDKDVIIDEMTERVCELQRRRLF